MARVKVSKVPVETRIYEVCRVLRERESDAYSKEAYAYACGYMETSLVRALDLLPVGKRELFLASLEKQVGK